MKIIEENASTDKKALFSFTKQKIPNTKYEFYVVPSDFRDVIIKNLPCIDPSSTENDLFEYYYTPAAESSDINTKNKEKAAFEKYMKDNVLRITEADVTWKNDVPLTWKNDKAKINGVVKQTYPIEREIEICAMFMTYPTHVDIIGLMVTKYAVIKMEPPSMKKRPIVLDDEQQILPRDHHMQDGESAYNLNAKDRKILSDDGYATDAVIDSLMKMMISSHHTDGNLDQLYYMNPYFMQRLSDNGKTFDKDNIAILFKDRMDKLFTTRNGDTRASVILDKRYIIFPLNIDNAHWITLIIYRPFDNQIKSADSPFLFVIDPLRFTTAQYYKDYILPCLLAFFKLHAEKYSNNTSYKVNEKRGYCVIPVNKQESNINCGFFSCMFINEFCGMGREKRDALITSVIEGQVYKKDKDVKYFEDVDELRVERMRKKVTRILLSEKEEK